jgi:hypothetical protein
MLRVSYWNDCHGVIYLLVNVQLIQSSLRWSKVGQKELALVANVWLPCGSSLCHVGQVAELRSCWHQQLLLGRHVVFWWYHLQARRFTQYNQSPKHDKSFSTTNHLSMINHPPNLSSWQVSHVYQFWHNNQPHVRSHGNYKCGQSRPFNLVMCHHAWQSHGL